jgi:hypothetical protein
MKSTLSLGFSFLTVLSGCDSDRPAVEGGDAGPPIAVDGSIARDALSSDGGPALCSLGTCGGDLVGRWEFDAACLPPRPAPVDDCGGGQHWFDTRVEGTLDFRADGSVIAATRLVQDISSYLPTRCIPGGGACDGFFNGYDRCETHDGFCDCFKAGGSPLETSTDEYRLEGNALTFIDAEGETHVTYCVEGGVLRYFHEGNVLPEHLRRIE